MVLDSKVANILLSGKLTYKVEKTEIIVTNNQIFKESRYKIS